jgi:glutamine synthetase
VPTAQVLLEMTAADGEPFFADPRQVLRRAARPLHDLGLQPVVATELEFYLLEGDGERPTPHAGRIPGTRRRQDGLQFATMEDLADVDPFLAEVHAACKTQEVPAGATVKEFSPGQYEVNLQHVPDPELACDHAVLLKRIVKAVALRHGMAASFMAKPFAEFAGSSLHIHISLRDDKKRNVFAGSTAGEISETLRHAIGGLAATMAEGMAIFAPNANSYRRYRPGLFVPLTPNWGTNHRGVALRVPLSAPEDSRIEHRPGGADGNPYLVMAAVLAGIHHGITNRCEPGPMIGTGQVIEDERITLPVRWDAALDAFEAGRVLPKYLGERYHRIFAACRREEAERFHAQITDRDYEWYLRAV